MHSGHRRMPIESCLLQRWNMRQHLLIVVMPMCFRIHRRHLLDRHTSMLGHDMSKWRNLLGKFWTSPFRSVSMCNRLHWRPMSDPHGSVYLRPMPERWTMSARVRAVRVPVLLLVWVRKGSLHGEPRRMRLVAVSQRINVC